MDPKKESLRKIPTVHAVPAAGDIGSVLKAARQKKGVSVDAVAQQTRIPKKYLEAMEANRTDELPALVYLRGFLKGYCDFLEVEFEPLWKLLQPAPPPAAAPAGDEAHAAPAPKQAPAKPLTPQPAHHDARGDKRDPRGLVILAASIALAVGVFVWLSKQKPEPTAPRVEPAALAAISQSDDELVISFNEETWVSVKADGALLFEGLAPRGARQTWKAKKGFNLRTPHPRSLTVLLNGATQQLSEPTPEGDYRLE